NNLIYTHETATDTDTLSLHDALPIYYKTLLKNGVITKKQYDKMLNQARKHDGKTESSQLNTLNKMRKNTDKYYDKVAKIQSGGRSEEHTSELQSRFDLVCRLLLEKKK